MTRIPAVFLAGLLLIGRPVAAAEYQPSDYYTTAFTILGSIGGAALGSSIGGLSRPDGSSTVRPFMQWGFAGAVAGSILGRDIAQFSLESQTDLPGPKPVSTREANACLGALGGQLAGYAIVAVANDPIHRTDRTVWAGIALGTLLGSAIGYFLPPIPLITLPPEQSGRERLHAVDTTRLEPLIPPGRDDSTFMSRTETVPAETLGPTRPFLPASKLEKLDTMLMTPENDRMMGTYRPVFPQEAPSRSKPMLAPLDSPEAMDSGPALQLSALAGLCLGATTGASMGGSRDDMLTRTEIGGAAGLFGGWLLARTILNPSKAASGEELEATGNILSMASAWTIAGTMAGIGAGAALRNNIREFHTVDSARVTLGFGFLGLVGGVLTTSF